MKKLLLVLMMVPMLAPAVVRDANGKIARSRTEVARFKRMHPCPATGLPYGPCKNWIVDHRVALCVGGEDSHRNMQWMTAADAKWKDGWECKPGWEKKLAGSGK